MNNQYMVFDQDQLMIMIGALVEEKVRVQQAGNAWQAKRLIITANTLIEMYGGNPGYLDEEQLEQAAGALERAVENGRGVVQNKASQALWLAARLREVKAERERRFLKAPYVMVKGKRKAVLLKAREVAAYLQYEKTARGERTA
ncbi:hypothetical protein BBR47_35730 [Brevibacillus brevis NBRC 100599]|uniref:Uncharacterized protein n=1 Tax=Brevibacillus brevis (strain 47 / JCM 6285 / NBRC 100599) TaxID=358681 RepID=C0ZFJ1_BREBN|nr:hypothetical protein [Brevibacillus brevis]BAH44550.1 hypothetical protein BBR47_35730 [Brevibacillus brevis NBRC 100599]